LDEISAPTNEIFNNKDEVAEYFKISLSKKSACPLAFWKAEQTRFPILAELAKIYLGMPASSGNVERLFSIAGAIARSRRARITLKNLEMILCIRDSLKMHEENDLSSDSEGDEDWSETDDVEED
jgi:hypothetical protein